MKLLSEEAPLAFPSHPFLESPECPCCPHPSSLPVTPIFHS